MKEAKVIFKNMETEMLEAVITMKKENGKCGLNIDFNPSISIVKDKERSTLLQRMALSFVSYVQENGGI